MDRRGEGLIVFSAILLGIGLCTLVIFALTAYGGNEETS